jgi:AcrR family transcriptional regulator
MAEPHPPSKLRGQITRAAHELFSTRGYRGVTTKEISLRAGVSEPTLFRLFGSKAGLYEATVLEPFTAFVADWTSDWLTFPDGASALDMCGELVRGLYQLVHADRALFLELISAHSDPNNDLYPTADAVNRQIRKALRAVQDVGVRTTEHRELSHVDGPVTVASIASMLFGMVLFDKWVYPAGSRPAGRDRMINEITRTVYYGIARRPQHDRYPAENARIPNI